VRQGEGQRGAITVGARGERDSQHRREHPGVERQDDRVARDKDEPSNEQQQPQPQSRAH